LIFLLAVGRGAGYKNLDAIRALKKSTAFTGIDPNATTVTLGYSGGVFGGEMAAELHSTYAPEVKIDGMALGGLLPNLTHLLSMK
jgi:Secretory lipase